MPSNAALVSRLGPPPAPASPSLLVPPSSPPSDTRALAANLREQYNHRLSSGDRFFPLSTVAHAEAWSVYAEVFPAPGCCSSGAGFPRTPLPPPPLSPPAATPLEIAALAAASRVGAAELLRGGCTAPPPAALPPPRADDAGADLLALCVSRWRAAGAAAVAAAGAVAADAPEAAHLGGRARAVPLVLQRATGGRVVVAVRLSEAEALGALADAAAEAALLGAAAAAAAGGGGGGGGGAAAGPRMGTVQELFALLGVAPPPAAHAPGAAAAAAAAGRATAASARAASPERPRAPAAPASPSPALTLRGSLAFTAHGVAASPTIARLRASVEALDARLVSEVGAVAMGGAAAGGSGGREAAARAPAPVPAPAPTPAGAPAARPPPPPGPSPRLSGLTLAAATPARGQRSRSPVSHLHRTPRIAVTPVGSTPPMNVLSPLKRRI
jgi:hypothetical protein